MNTNADNSHRRTYRFRILIGVVIPFVTVSAYFSHQVSRVLNHERAIFALQDAGAELILTTGDNRGLSANGELQAGWYSRLSGTPSTYVPFVQLTANSITPDDVRGMVPYLNDLIALKGQNIAEETFIAVDVTGNTTITPELVVELRNALPNCRITGDVDGAAENP